MVVLVLCVGKEAENATLSHGVIMCQAIKTYYEKTGYQVFLHILFSCFQN